MEHKYNLALYRKYRPSTFDEVVGQDHVTITIKNSLKAGQFSHAYLFAGPRGTGKTTIARLIARSLNCENAPTDSPCGECQACRAIQVGTFMDVIEIDAASNRGIDDIRSLRDHVRFAPSQGGYKVYIIDEVHMLTQDASNALLKTLEEPPPKTVFILATTEKHKVLPTIQSRCQVFEFRRLPVNIIVEKLREIAEKEKINIDGKSLAILAKKSRGGMRDALVLLEQARAFSGNRVTPEVVFQLIGYLPEDVLLKIVESLLSGETMSAIKTIKELDNSGQDLRSAASLIRKALSELIIYKHTDVYHEDYILEKDSMDRIKSMVSGDTVSNLLGLLEDADRGMRFGEDPELALEVAFLRFHFNKQAADEKEASSHSVSALRIPSKEIIPINSSASIQKRVSETGSEAIRKHWRTFLEKLKSKSLSLHMHLKEGKPVKIEDSLLTIRFPSGCEDYVNFVSTPENTSMIEEVLRLIFRKKLSVRYEIAEDLTAKISEEKEGILNTKKPATETGEPNSQPISSLDEFDIDKIAQETASEFEGKIENE